MHLNASKATGSPQRSLLNVIFLLSKMELTRRPRKRLDGTNKLSDLSVRQFFCRFSTSNRHTSSTSIAKVSAMNVKMNHFITATYRTNDFVLKYLDFARTSQYQARA